MEYRDLREWIRAGGQGEVRTLTGGDWNLEIGAVTELVHHKEDGPAVNFRRK
jgi:hypothetical protein